ncbi:hypothetical protein D3C80_1810910 [compost metagenome]
MWDRLGEREVSREIRGCRQLVVNVLMNVFAHFGNPLGLKFFNLVGGDHSDLFAPQFVDLLGRPITEIAEAFTRS